MTNAERLLGIPYVFANGPEAVPDLEAARAIGANCIALIHLFVQEEFGVALPPVLHCWELYQDTDYLVDIPEGDITDGDLILLGPAQPPITAAEFRPVYNNGKLINWENNPIKHGGICVGRDNDGSPRILHGSPSARESVIQSLDQITLNKRHASLRRSARFAMAYQPAMAIDLG